MKIELIDADSAYLTDVIQLWRRNSRTLGYFPEGAFREHAAKRCILVAYGDKRKLLGYLLFRVVRKGCTWPQAVVVHLCVDEELRGEGVAKALVENLRHLARDRFLRIELSCRRDYDANELWPKLGFVYKAERIGRGRKPIAIWQMELRPLPLIALLDEKRTEHRLCVVLDANVLYRLQDPVSDCDEATKLLSEEAKALEEDWLSNDLALLVTDETFNEIQRNDDAGHRQYRVEFAQQYPRVSSQLDEVRKAEQDLGSVFAGNSDEKVESDIRQLAHAIAGGAHFFTTQDTGLLKKAGAIHQRFDIRILSPGELISHIDEMIREVEYHPKDLAGSGIAISKIHSDQISALDSHFRRPDLHEKKAQFQSRLRTYMAQPDRYRVLVSHQRDGEPLALIAYDQDNPDELIIPLLRTSRSPLSGTIARYLLLQAILVSTNDGRAVTRITDDDSQSDLAQALNETGFSHTNDQWIKLNLSQAGTSSQLSSRIDRIIERSRVAAPLAAAIKSTLSRAIETQDALTLADIERRLWPAKILDADISTFIVPIQPMWAQHLFDEGMARQTLWGAREDLVLRNENVYYRAKRNSRNIASPARILWYVSHGKNYQMSMHIRACSFLDEVIVGTPKGLFQRFQRLGVYEWNDILRITGGDYEKEIMALRFSNTELFRNPIDLPTLGQVLQETEHMKPWLRSPQPISSRSFALLYKAGSSTIEQREN